MNGAFIMPRDIFENPIWQHNIELRLFLLIVGKAIYAEEGYDIGEIHLERGQWLRSYRNLQSDLEWLENNSVKKPGLATVKRIINKFETHGIIITKTTDLGTLFTVIDYAKYQDFETHKKKTRNSARNSSRTAAEQQRNNNNQVNQENNIILFPPEETEPLKPLADTESFFRECWDLYPNKKGQVSKTQKEELFKLGDELKRCISRYLTYVDSERKRGFSLQYKNGSTFFNNGYKDYLDSVCASDKLGIPDCSKFKIKYVEQEPAPVTEKDTGEVDF